MNWVSSKLLQSWHLEGTDAQMVGVFYKYIPDYIKE
jgi:hypothetical protein